MNRLTSFIRNYVMDDSANDADGEGDGSVRGKIRRGKKANLKGTQKALIH